MLKPTTTALATPNASRETHLKRIPTLRRGNDDKVAIELETYITDAETGLRSILKAGFFIECIAADLPHGQLGPWVEAHCPTRKWRTIQRWKEVAASLGDDVGISLKKRLELRLHEVLSLPIDQVPDKIKPIREKLDAEISGKTYRQLFLEFKQTDGAGNVCRGNLSGRGNPKAQRVAATALEEKARVEALTAEVKAMTKRILELADDKHLGAVADDAFFDFLTALDTASGYMRPVAATRRSGRSVIPVNTVNQVSL